MSKVDIWMPLFIGDFLKDTMRLNTEQRGAYLLLLMEHWVAGPIPDDDEELAQITGLSIADWRKHRTKLARYFVIEAGQWRQVRLEHEKELADKRREASIENGKKGGRPRKDQTVTPFPSGRGNARD